VWKRAEEGVINRIIEESLKFGGGFLMIRGCMFWEGGEYGCKIDGRTNAELYIQILKNELPQSLEYYYKKVIDIIFQQNNDPKHMSKKPPNGLKIMDTLLWSGLVNLQTLVLLKQIK
jgi:hypothetical protein